MPEKERDLTPFDITLKGKPNAVAVMVPVDFANGVAVLCLESEHGFASLASVKMIPGYYKNGNFRRSSQDLEITPDTKVLYNLGLALRYLIYRKDLLSKKRKKGNLPTFSGWKSYVDMTKSFPSKDLEFVEPF